MLIKCRVYITLIFAVVLTLTLNIIWSHNNCAKDFDQFQVNTSNIASDGNVTEIVDCKNIVLEKKLKQRGGFIVFENYIRAEQQFEYHESITLTAPGDYRFLDNVVPLVESWDGPISIALYAPGQDFFTTLQCVAYLRNCATLKVRELVTFHLFFENEYMPLKNGSSLADIYKDTFDCTLKPPYQTKKDSDMFKEKHSLTYPINVARNIAKLAAQTHFVFPSDIELYHTRNFIPKFLDLIKRNRRNPEYAEKGTRKVFVLPIFEILAGEKIPENKTELQVMFKKKKAILFHQHVCSPCHKIPRQKEWFKAKETRDLDVFHVTKRQGEQIIWEPFFVCTQEEPLWDERLNWEGQGNKMCQAYALCILDYDFLVLDNAFLIHKPGVKKKQVQIAKHIGEVRKNEKILATVQKELQIIYGSNKKCKIHNVPGLSN